MCHLGLHFCFLHQSPRMLSSVAKFLFSSEVVASGPWCAEALPGVRGGSERPPI